MKYAVGKTQYLSMADIQYSVTLEPKYSIYCAITVVYRIQSTILARRNNSMSYDRPTTLNTSCHFVILRIWISDHFIRNKRSGKSNSHCL